MTAHIHPPEPVVSEQLRLQPLYDRSARLLGQLAGILLLGAAGRDPAAQRRHLPVLHEQHEAASAAYRHLAPPRHLQATFRAVGVALAEIGAALAELEAAAAAPLLFARLQAARRALQQGSRPALGLAPVDLATACCAGRSAPYQKSPPPLRGRVREGGAAAAISPLASPPPQPAPDSEHKPKGAGETFSISPL